MSKIHNGLGKITERASRVKHPFVIAVICVYSLFIILGINGSSIGIYSKDPSGLIASDRIGRPRPIRSDEWLVNTQLTISQKEAGYPLINPNIGDGENVSVVFDVPYKEWSTLFKPQNLVFFFIPFASAFAFKWWFSTVVLLLSSYFVAYFFLNKRKDARLISALLSISIGFSSMLVWWHQATTVTALSIAYLMLISNFFLRSVDPEKSPASLPKKFLQFVLTTYILASWAMLMYPPFQIASAIGFGALLIGYTLESLKKYGQDKRERLLRLAKNVYPYLLGAISALAIFALFLYTRKEIIEIIQNTAYPGKRTTLSGGVYLKDLVFGPYDYALQFGTRAADLSKISSNQSELSTFGPWWFISILFMPILLILQRAKNGIRKIDLKAVALTIASVTVLIRMVLPAGDIFYKPLLLSLVPHYRLKLAFIVLGFFSLIIWILEYPKVGKVKRLPMNLLLLAVFLSTFASGRLLNSGAPRFLSGNVEILIVSVLTTLILYLLIKKKTLSVMLVITTATLMTVATVNPIQKGLGALDPGSEQFKTARIESSKLISKDDLIIESSSLLQESLSELLGYRSLTAVYGYPQKDLWKNIEPNNEAIYNRYAHVNADISDDSKKGLSLELKGADIFVVKGDYCDLRDASFNNQKVTKILSTSTITSQCLKLLGGFEFTNRNILVYKVV